MLGRSSKPYGYCSKHDRELKLSCPDCNKEQTRENLEGRREINTLGEESERQKFKKLLSQMTFDIEDVHIFDTSYEYRQVRIDCVFINENSELWQAFLKEEI